MPRSKSTKKYSRSKSTKRYRKHKATGGKKNGSRRRRVKGGNSAADFGQNAYGGPGQQHAGADNHISVNYIPNC